MAVHSRFFEFGVGLLAVITWSLSGEASADDGFKAPVIVDAFVGGGKMPLKAASIRKLPVRIQGLSGLVVDKLDDAGQILTRMISWGDKFLIAIDRDGDGAADEWEFFSDRTRVKMSAPTHGHFNLMEVDYIQGGQRLQMGFQRSGDGQFGLRARSTRAVEAEFEEARKSGAENDGAFVEATEAPLDVRKRILAVQEKHVRGAIERVADPSQCLKDDGNPQNLTQGIADVVMSAAGERGESHLSCLRQQGFGASAAYVSARFFPTAVPEGKSPANWGITCQKCEVGGRANPLCAGKKPEGKALGAFQAASEKERPRIVLMRDAKCKDTACEPSPAQYARTFQHEMLHMSGVRSENEIEALGQCCAPVEGKKRDCGAAESQGRVRERTENYLQLYFHLSDRTRESADQLCARLPANQAQQCPISYLKKVADDHQQMIERNSAGACRDENSGDCRKILKQAEAQAFKGEISARCESANQDAKAKCQESAESLAKILGVKNEPAKAGESGEKLDLSESGKLVKAKGLGPVRRHQLPTGQMERDTVASGKRAAENMAPSGGAVLVYSPKGPKMPEDDGLTYHRNPERIQMMVESSVGKQVGVIDGLVARVSKAAGALVAAAPVQAVNVPDPSILKSAEGVVAVGQSLRVRRLLTHRESAGGRAKGGGGAALGAADASSSSPAKRALIVEMTSLGRDALKARLKRKETLKALADQKIGVIDETGERRDQTPDPVEWLIYDEESGQLRSVDAGD